MSHSSRSATARSDPRQPGRLHARVEVHLGTLDLDVEVVAEPGEVVAILGPNGAGKTTFLRALAGLIPLDAGRVSVRGAVLEDPAAGVRLTPQDRHVGVVFQDHLLFPHLSAVDNVAFGRQARGERRTAARQHAREWLDRVGLGEHADERPGALSGGQAQRVALARALATEPHLLLLDEPMAALDVDARREIRRELRRHLAAFGGPTLLITHEPLEAITLADRLVILEGGRIVQDAPPREIARRPRSDWAARLVGLNLYRGTGRDHDVELADGTVLATGDRVVSGELYVVIHPRAVVLHAEQPVGSARNVWQATVDSLDLYEDHVRVHLVGGVPIVAQITPAALAELALGEGSRVWVAVKATEVDAWVA